MEDIKTLFKISEVLGKALKQVNAICAHHLARSSLEEEKPSQIEGLNQNKIQRVNRETDKQTGDLGSEKKLKKKKPSEKQINYAERSVTTHPSIEEQQKLPEKSKPVDHPEKPKAPLTAFFLFQQEQKQNFKKAHPSKSLTEITSVLGQIWRDMTAEEKEPFMNQYAKQKSEYQRRLAKFYVKNPAEKSKSQLKKQRKSQKDKQVHEQPKQVAPKQASEPREKKPTDKKYMIVEESGSDSGV